MTIAIAWVRKIKDGEELVFVSDSRLSGDGRLFDGCVKIMTLPRSDCAISFGGYTGDAFPMMLQLALAIDSNGASKLGVLDIAPLRAHVLKVFDGLADQIESSTYLSKPQDTSPNATFLFGGYSWIRKEFRLWSISYSRQDGARRFVAHPNSWLGYSPSAKSIVLRPTKRPFKGAELGRIAFTGDQAPLAKQLLLEKLNEARLSGTVQTSLNMEPFEVVRDMLRDPNHSETIGGAPQVVKVYQYMRATALGVYWPQKEGGRVHLHGRACLGYERIDNWILDPDTLHSEKQPAPASIVQISSSEADGA